MAGAPLHETGKGNDNGAHEVEIRALAMGCHFCPRVISSSMSGWTLHPLARHIILFQVD